MLRGVLVGLVCCLHAAVLFVAPQEGNQYDHGLGELNSVCFGSTAETLVLGSSKGEVLIWDLRSNKKTRLPDSNQFVGALLFDPNTGNLITGQGRGVVSIYKAGDYRLAIRKDCLAGEPIFCAAIGSEQKKLIIAGGGTKIKVLQLESLELYCELEGQKPIVTALVLSKDEKVLYSASHDKTIRVWNLDSKKEAATLGPLNKEARGLVLTSDGKWLVSVDLEGAIIVWDTKTHQALFRLLTSQGPMTAVCLLPGKDLVAVASFVGTVEIWDLSAKKRVQSWNRILYGASYLGVSSDGTSLLVASHSGEVRTIKDVGKQKK